MAEEQGRGKMFLVEDAVSAHNALREAAGLGPEHFPLQAFVGMISDEVQQLREGGWKDEAIAELIAKSSPIKITAQEIAENYAPPEQRRR